MNSRCTRRFWRGYEKLPGHVRELADKAYALWSVNPGHPSLNFERLAGGDGRHFSVRVGYHYRAIGREVAGGVEWVWIGSHEDYNRLL
jgi:hypothetical protein